MNCGQLFSLNIQSVTIKHGPDGVSDSRFELRFNINLTRDSRPHTLSGCKEHNPQSSLRADIYSGPVHFSKRYGLW